MLFVRWLLYFARPGTIKVDFLPAPRFPFSGLPADDQRRRSGASQLPPPPFSRSLLPHFKTHSKPNKPYVSHRERREPKVNYRAFKKRRRGKKKFNFRQVIEHDDKRERRERDTKTITAIRSPLARSLATRKKQHTLGLSFFHADDRKTSRITSERAAA